MRQRIVRSVIILSALLLASVFVMFPVMMGTKTYPIAIVEGNSMYPNIQNGDLVIFHSVSTQSITNGTIIVFIQGETGITMVDSLIKPVVIHRVIDTVVQYDGMINYQTKGDNNKESDPSLVKSSYVLGTPLKVVPKLGLLFLFIRSSQGMVAIVGFITLLYLGNYETKIKKDEKRSEFLGALAKMVFNDELSEDLFRKFEIAVNYADDVNINDMSDGCVRSVLDWINKGGLDHIWKIVIVTCHICGSIATKLDSSNDLTVTVCMTCEKIAQCKKKNMKGKPDITPSDVMNDDSRMLERTMNH